MVKKREKKSYADMTRAERKVAICKDVILQIQRGQINITKTGDYFRGRLLGERSGRDLVPADIARRLQKECSMCALGALMISKVAKFNEATFSDIGLDEFHADKFSAGSDITVDALNSAFEKLELFEIEAAFECTVINSQGYPLCHFDPYVNFGEEFDDPFDRLMAICQNIVDHKGEFKPEMMYGIVNF